MVVLIVLLFQPSPFFFGFPCSLCRCYPFLVLLDLLLRPPAAAYSSTRLDRPRLVRRRCYDSLVRAAQLPATGSQPKSSDVRRRGWSKNELQGGSLKGGLGDGGGRVVRSSRYRCRSVVGDVE